MRLGPILILCIAVAFLTSCHAPATKTGDRDGPLILISIDGFRWDYLQLHDAPTLRQLAREGVHATRLTPSFPSKTFPNHYTLVTGLRPQNHGIVANWFYDPALNEMFTMRKTAAAWWDGGEPIWITAEKSGVRSACFFWPGSEVEFAGRRPALWRAFDIKLTPTERVDGLLAWLAMPAAQRPTFCTLYFDHVDTAGHTFGPTAAETRVAVKQADDAIARLLAGLEALGLRDRANLVLVSDHGMAECDLSRVIYLDDLMDLSKVRVESTGPNGGVRPLEGDARALVASIRAKAPPQLKVYLREDVPAHLHYNRGERIPPIVFIADEYWNIEQKATWRQRIYPKGSHGWDPTLPSMGALFIANGPAFKRGVEIPAVENVHVYPMLCTILGLTPAPNDGDARLSRAALRHH